MGAKLVTVTVINQTSDTWQFATQNIGFTRIDAGCSTSYKEDRKVKCNIHFRHENQKCESFKYEFDTNNQIYCNDVTFIIFETDNCKIALRCVNDGVTHYRPNDLMALKEETEVLNKMEEKDQYNNHHEFVTGEKQTEKISLRKRAKKKGSRSRFTCQQCGTSFNKKGNLNRHMRVHTGERPYRCAKCGKSFNQKRYFKDHIRIHTGEKPFTCKQCGKSFNQKGNFNNHMRTHSDEKPYICPRCGISFTLKGSFNSHVKIHTGEKSYSCKQCGKSFNLKGNLDRHMRIHTGERPFKCGHCEKTFRYNATLEYHMRFHV